MDMTRVRRGLAVAGVSVGLIGGGMVGASPATAFKDKNCDDFKSQKQAQKFFKKNNPKKDPHGLDADGDGKACEDSF